MQAKIRWAIMSGAVVLAIAACDPEEACWERGDSSCVSVDLPVLVFEVTALGGEEGHLFGGQGVPAEQTITLTNVGAKRIGAENWTTVETAGGERASCWDFSVTERVLVEGQSLAYTVKLEPSTLDVTDCYLTVHSIRVHDPAFTPDGSYVDARVLLQRLPTYQNDLPPLPDFGEGIGLPGLTDGLHWDAVMSPVDLDADGDVDLVMRSEDALRVLENVGRSGAPSWVENNALARLPGADDSAGPVAFGDLDGDGDLDALAFCPLTGLRNDGSPHSPAFVDAPDMVQGPLTTCPRSAVLVDLDADGDLDLLTDDLSAALENVGGPLFPVWSKSQRLVEWAAPFRGVAGELAVGDFFGGPHPDIVIRVSFTFHSPRPHDGFLCFVKLTSDLKLDNYRCQPEAGAAFLHFRSFSVLDYDADGASDLLGLWQVGAGQPVVGAFLGR